VFIPQKGNEDFQAVLEDVIGEYQSLHLIEDQEIADMKKQQDERIKQLHAKLLAEKKDNEAEVLRIKHKSLFPSDSDIEKDLKDWKKSVVQQTRTMIVAENFRQKYEDAKTKLEHQSQETISLCQKVLSHGQGALDAFFAKDGLAAGLSLEEVAEKLQATTKRDYAKAKSSRKKFEKQYPQELDTTVQTEPETEPEEEESDRVFHEALQIWIDPDTQLYYATQHDEHPLGQVARGKPVAFRSKTAVVASVD
jgi:hypothetical protein